MSMTTDLEFLKSDEGQKAIKQKFDDLESADRERAELALTKIMSAAESGSHDDAVSGVEGLQSLGGDPWTKCEEFCRHHLNEGNAPAYAVCYAACVARGGP
jgi:hypothetical protein